MWPGLELQRVVVPFQSVVNQPNILTVSSTWLSSGVGSRVDMSLIVAQNDISSDSEQKTGDPDYVWYLVC